MTGAGGQASDAGDKPPSGPRAARGPGRVPRCLGHGQPFPSGAQIGACPSAPFPRPLRAPPGPPATRRAVAGLPVGPRSSRGTGSFLGRVGVPVSVLNSKSSSRGALSPGWPGAPCSVTGLCAPGHARCPRGACWARPRAAELAVLCAGEDMSQPAGSGRGWGPVQSRPERGQGPMDTSPRCGDTRGT